MIEVLGVGHGDLGVLLVHLRLQEGLLLGGYLRCRLRLGVSQGLLCRGGLAFRGRLIALGCGHLALGGGQGALERGYLCLPVVRRVQVSQRLPHFSATEAVVPLPQVMSNTRSLGSVVINIQRLVTSILV